LTRIVGIDLGTTHSLIAVFEENGPRMVPDYSGNVLTPSVVASVDDDQVLVGFSAKELMSLKPEHTASQFKRHMGEDRSLILGKRSFSPQELSSMVLSSLKRDAEAFMGQEVTDAVITVPAYFNENQRQATVAAGELAGLKVRRIINEPTAAALTYGFHEADADKKILVFDLGGGTFDVTIMEIFEGSLEIVSTAGESQLGGEDFTESLCRDVCQQVRLDYDSLTPIQRAKLIREGESVKRKLSQAEAVTLRIPNVSGQFDEDCATLEVSRAHFEKACESLITRLRRPLSRALRDATCAPEDIEEVILVGGATRMPLVHGLIVKAFDKPPLHRFDPDHVVALGAAVQAALLEEHQAVEDMVLTDVAPHTLGVETVKQRHSEIKDGYFTPVIHRNTTIPVSREEVFSTVYDFQPSLTIRVFQGESRRVDQNLFLGELNVKDLPTAPAGLEVVVRFTYDVNGLLSVEALVPRSGQHCQTLLTNHCPSLSKSQIDRALRDMERIKFFPRHDAANRDLLHFAENVVAELSGGTREFLEQAIDRFEAEMVRAERETFELAKEYLLQSLAKVGFRYEEHRGQHD
jgi:molecular chaperone HscC